MRTKISYLLCVLLIVFAGCRKEELNVQNPNSPTSESAKTESGILSLSLGAVYQTGFNGITDTKYSGSFLGSSFWFLALAYHDLLADVISAEAANNIINQVSVPDYVIFDDGTKVTNTAPAKQVIRLNNSRGCFYNPVNSPAKRDLLLFKRELFPQAFGIFNFSFHLIQPLKHLFLFN